MLSPYHFAMTQAFLKLLTHRACVPVLALTFTEHVKQTITNTNT